MGILRIKLHTGPGLHSLKRHGATETTNTEQMELCR